MAYPVHLSLPSSSQWKTDPEPFLDLSPFYRDNPALNYFLSQEIKKNSGNPSRFDTYSSPLKRELIHRVDQRLLAMSEAPYLQSWLKQQSLDILMVPRLIFQEMQELNLVCFFEKVTLCLVLESHERLAALLPALIRCWMEKYQDRLCEIESLDLSSIPFTTLPPEIRYLKNLKKLELDGRNLQFLPKEIKELKKLSLDTLPQLEFV